MKKSPNKISKKTSKRKSSMLNKTSKIQREKENLRNELLKIKARQELIKNENKSEAEELLKSLRNLRNLDFVYLHAGIDSPLSRQIEKFRMNPSTVRKNPGGGWIFEGKFANKWDAFRSLDKSLFGKFSAQVRDRKDNSWWNVTVFRDFKSVGLTPAGASKFSNIIKIINLESEYRKIPVFTGKSNDWIDWRIGYDSGGVEVLDKKGVWWSVNVWIRNEVVEVIDIRYPVDKD